MEVTTEQIQEFSVGVVKDYIDNKVPLSEGIAKVASENELNPEQVKRVVEACNTVTYLTLQKQASDRTFEFKVADYNEVMGHLVIPSGPNGVVTEAEFIEGQTKEASEKHTYVPDVETAKSWAYDEWQRNTSALEKLAHDKAECLMNIGDLTKEILKDGWALEKLAEVATEEEFKKLGSLLGDTTKPLRDRIFKEAELSQVQNLVNLYKKAQELVAETAVREELDKKAMLQWAAGAAGKGIGLGAGAAVGGAATLGKKILSKGTKSKLFHPLDVGMAALTEVKPSRNIWDNLQGTKKRF